MNAIRSLLLCWFLLSQCAAAGDSTATGSRWTFLPSGTLFTPLPASWLEPRIGVEKQIGSSRMRLDIGSTFDMLEVRVGDFTGRAGVDFFTYALSTSANGHRLQIDAVDGIFGGNITSSVRISHGCMLFRLRLLHLSAHFLDGHYDNAAGGWKDGQEPIPYTRDFGELTALYESGTTSWLLMPYAGAAYATLVRPVDVQRFSCHAGVTVLLPPTGGTVFGQSFRLYGSLHFTVTGTPAYGGTTRIEGGIRFGEWRGRGIRIYGGYYAGFDAFSQYFTARRSFASLGFAFDPW